ncbi:MAG: ATP-binding protein [Sandaracinaceae bacterium]
MVEVATGDLAEQVRSVRERRGPLPLGVAAPTEAAALDALRAGADEAAVIDASPVRVHAFVDRVILRATLRREQERTSAAVSHAEKLTALGTLVAGIAHEINNPLTAISLTLASIEAQVRPLTQLAEEAEQLASLERPLQPEELRALVAQLGNDPRLTHELAGAFAETQSLFDMATNVVRDLRVFARTDEGEPAVPVDVRDLVDNVSRLVRREIQQHAVFERDLPVELPKLLAPRSRLAQVLTNVLVNALHAVREVERDSHRVRISVRADDEAVAIAVSDTGPGISPEHVERIFDPFFTTKRQSLGTGLGLSISRSIMRSLGGDLLVESIHGQGAEFVLLLPLPEPDALARSSRVIGLPRTSRPPGRRTILVVDDDERMLRAYARALGNEHDVVSAVDGEEAIALLESGTEADVVISEVSMPGMDGEALHEWLERERPSLARACLFVTSLEASDPSRRRLDARGASVIEKPVDRPALVAWVSKSAASS